MAKIVTRTWTWVMMICRRTHKFSLFLPLSLLLSLWRTRSPSFSLSFPLSLLSWYLLIKIKFLDISWLKTLFFVMFRKVCIYSKTHPLTRSRKYPPSHKYHIHTSFLRVRCQVKKTPTSHANTLYDALWHCHYAPKQNSLRRRPPAALRGSALQWRFKTCSQPIPQKLVLNTFITFQILFPPLYGVY